MMASHGYEDRYSDNVTYSLSTANTIKVHVPAIKGKRVVAFGFNCLVAIDKYDDLCRARQSTYQGDHSAA
ncbi:hypothetical protein E2562_010215 [Oryza meyeriana var. granulata]|uniref:Uncharacterized protein n=1 Tax=Oryza meyeriana var. granulata TaxID=110450 RepID=A0A6G1EIF2_9ORYZ|nr:hypothetical protein E2562_010215 [Oryza meyeriana var. granulata]